MAQRQAGGRRADLMKRGGIWLVRPDPAEGHEQKARCQFLDRAQRTVRPVRLVLVVSAEVFNRVTKVPVVLPITSGGSFVRTAGFAVPLAEPGPRQLAWCGAISRVHSISVRVAAGSWKAFQTQLSTRCWRGWH